MKITNILTYILGIYTTKNTDTDTEQGIKTTLDSFLKVIGGNKEVDKTYIQKLISRVESDKSDKSIRDKSKRSLILQNLYGQLGIKKNNYQINQIQNNKTNFRDKPKFNPSIKSETADGFFGMENATGKEAIINFANDTFGGGVLKNGFVQEEKLLLESNLLSEVGNFSNLTNQPLYIKGKSTHKFVGKGIKAYGNNLGNYDLNKNNVNYFLEKRNKPIDVNIISMAAVKMIGKNNYGKDFNYGKYHMNNFETMFNNAYTGFLEHKNNGGDIIHTGAWGAGDFGNSENATCVIQILAAQKAGIKLIYHGNKKSYESAIRLISQNQGKTYYQIFQEIINRGHPQNINSNFWAPSKNISR